LSSNISEVLSYEISLPAAGQGAIGIEARSADADTLRVLVSLEDPETRAAVTAERSALAGLGGGCQVPIGAWGRMGNGKLLLDVAVLSPDGTQRLVEKDAGSVGEADAIGRRVAQKLRERGATALLERESRGTPA
jgi:hydroxymethylbilane synthase